MGSNSLFLSISGKPGVGLLFSEMFPKLTGPSWSLNVSCRGCPRPDPSHGAGMCSRPPLPALSGASLCWGVLRGTWGRVYPDELQPPQDPREVLREKLGRVHADRSPGLLRTRGEALGRCRPASTLAGALWATSGPVGSLQEDVGPHPH